MIDLTQSEKDGYEVLLELQKLFTATAPKPVSLDDVRELTLSNVGIIEIAYREVTGEWLLRVDSSGFPSIGPNGKACTHLIRIMDFPTKALKSYRGYLKAWREGTVKSAETEEAYITEILLGRLDD